MNSTGILIPQIVLVATLWVLPQSSQAIDTGTASKKDATNNIVRVAGIQRLKFGEINLVKPLENKTPFLIAGPKLYEYGAMDGTFPKVGRLDGDQGGIWCHPIKIMDGFAVEILEPGREPLHLRHPSQFMHELASCTFDFRENDLHISRQDFVLDEKPALVSFLTLSNETDKARQVELRFSGSVNIRPSWESQLPNGPDILRYQDGLMSALDSAMADKWGMVFGADRSPTGQQVNGRVGTLTYSVNLPSRGEATLRFLILGEHQAGVEAARGQFQSILSKSKERLARKEASYRDRILGGVKFDCSDKAVTDAFYCAKANVLLSEMDLRPYYPARFLATGFPVYTWLFGCDSFYSTAGVAAGGFDDAARGTLECLLHYAKQTKRGVHEVTSNGRVMGWNIQETPQMVLACWKHFLWTRDMAFLNSAFPVCRETVADALKTADRDHDGYLEGSGLMEQSGMGDNRIDAACYLYAAYESLAQMAEILGEKGADVYRRQAAELKRNFNRDFWNSNQKMWACSLRDDHTQTMDNYWAVVFPQQTGIADLDKALIALNRIQHEWVNDEWGFVGQRRPENKSDRVFGVVFGVHDSMLALTAFDYGMTELGWKMIKLSAKAPLQERMLGAFDEVMPGAEDIIQLWSFGPFLETVLGGLAGVRPQAQPDRVDFFPQLPGSLEWFKIAECRVGQHRVTLEHRRANGEIVTTVNHLTGDGPLVGTFWLPSRVENVSVDGRVIKPARRPISGSRVEFPALPYEISPGKSLRIMYSEP